MFREYQDETVCSDSCEMLAGKMHFSHSSRESGTAMPWQNNTPHKERNNLMYCIYSRIYKKNTNDIEFVKDVSKSFLSFSSLDNSQEMCIFWRESGDHRLKNLYWLLFAVFVQFDVFNNNKIVSSFIQFGEISCNSVFKRLLNVGR